MLRLNATMPKRPRENLARTEDGATYNKLQRPDGFLEEPPRKLRRKHNDSFDPESEGSISMEESSEDDIRATIYDSSKLDRTSNRRQKEMHSANGIRGCLPMDDDYDSEDSFSADALEYLRTVR